MCNDLRRGRGEHIAIGRPPSQFCIATGTIRACRRLRKCKVLWGSLRGVRPDQPSHGHCPDDGAGQSLRAIHDCSFDLLIQGKSIGARQNLQLLIAIIYRLNPGFDPE